MVPETIELNMTQRTHWNVPHVFVIGGSHQTAMEWKSVPSWTALYARPGSKVAWEAL